MPKPIPVPDELTQPFWDACSEQRLILQNCTACNNRLQYPPEKTCNQCGSADNLGWRPVEGKGHILSYLIQRDARVQRLREEQPFILALVTLDEDPGINFLSHLPGVPVDNNVPIGAPVEIWFEPTVPAENGAPVKFMPEWRLPQ